MRPLGSYNKHPRIDSAESALYLKEEIPSTRRKEVIDENYLNEDYFDDWVRNLPYQPFNLNQTKEEMFMQHFDKVVSGDVKNWDDLSKTILKSYHLQKPEQAKEFSNIKLLKVKDPFVLMKEFFNEYLSDETLSSTENTDVLAAYTNFTVKKLENVLGDTVYIKPTGEETNMFKRRIIAKLKQDGYACNPNFVCFYRLGAKAQNALADPNNKDAQANQKFLAQQYKIVVDKYVKGYLNHIWLNMAETLFDCIWGAVRSFCHSCEQHFTKQTLQQKEIAELQECVQNFFDSKYELLRAKYTKDGLKGRYATQVLDSTIRYTKGEATEKDMQVLSEFENRLYLLGKALAVTDENGNFPLNAFVILPMPVPAARDLMQRFIKSGFVESSKVPQIYHIRSSLTKLFCTELREQYMIVENPDFLLTKYKVKCRYFDNKTNTFKETDYSTPEKFEQLKAQVKEIAQRHNLPHYAICYNMIANSLVRDRYPINLSNIRQPAESTTHKQNSGKGKE